MSNGPSILRNRIQGLLATISLSIVDVLKKVERKLIPHQTVLLNFAVGNIVINRSIYVAVEFGIADLLKDGPKTIDQLADATGTNPDTLYRIMRTLASEGIFKAQRNKIFGPNELGRYLQTDVEDSLVAFIKSTGADWSNDIWGDILQTTKTGKGFYENKYGMNFFDWLRNNSTAQRLFTEGMANIASFSDSAVTMSYDFSPFESMVEVGGSGSQIISILKNHSEMKGILYDQPQTLQKARKDEEMKGRLEYIEGDFFEEIPPGHDAYLMKAILHDFDDQRAVELLEQLATAMRDDSTLLIIENLVKEDDNESDFGKILDVNVMAMMGGRVRTKEEYSQIIEAAGMELKRLISTGSPYSILEVKQVEIPGLKPGSASRSSVVRRSNFGSPTLNA